MSGLIGIAALLGLMFLLELPVGLAMGASGSGRPLGTFSLRRQLSRLWPLRFGERFPHMD